MKSMLSRGKKSMFSATGERLTSLVFSSSHVTDFSLAGRTLPSQGQLRTYFRRGRPHPGRNPSPLAPVRNSCNVHVLDGRMAEDGGAYAGVPQLTADS